MIISIGLILGSFYYGYILTQIPGGWLAHRYGAKYVFGIGVVMTALLTLLTPNAASVGVWCLVMVRIMEGIFQVVVLHHMHDHCNVHCILCMHRA